MKKFNIIKKSRKKSKDIDEKIEYLDKECQKTNLQEFMTTSNVYQGSTKVPNQDYNNFNGLSHGGYGLGLSGGDGNGAGGGYVGTITLDMHLGHAYTGRTGVAISPPHPITGQRSYAKTQTGIGGFFEPLRPGTKQGNYGGSLRGGALWFFDPDYNFGGQVGRWLNFEWSPSQKAWCFYDTSFITGSLFLNPNLDQYQLRGVNIGTQIKNTIAAINFGDNGEVGTPQTLVLTKNNLDDPSFIPIDIGGLSNQGYDYLKNKATDKYLAGVYDLMKRGQVPFLTPDQVNKILVDPKYQQLLQDDPDILKQLQRMRAMADDGTEIASTDPSAAFPSAPSPDSSMDTNQDGTKPSKAKGADAKLGKWMSRTDFMALYPNSSMTEYLNALPYGGTNFMKPDPNFPNARIVDTDAYEKYFMTGDTSGLSDSKPKHKETAEVEYTPQELKKGFTVNQTLNYLKTKFKSPLGPATDIMADIVANTFGQRGSKAVLDDYMRNFIPDLFSGKNVAGKTSDNPRNVGNMYSNKALNDFEKVFAKYQSEQKQLENPNIPDNLKRLLKDPTTNWKSEFHATSAANSEIGNTYGQFGSDVDGVDDFVENGDGTVTLTKRYDFDDMADLAGSDAASTLGAYSYGIISGIPALLGKGEGGKTPSSYLGITFDKKTGKVIKNYKKGIAESLDESVKLGHFEPEALTVDLEKLRKGILPEFPKNPPPKMIGGYSEKSKLRPKTIEGTPFINVTKKDLAKNHILKDSEIEKYMNEINMINDYIKKHPEELIHAMQRYPKDDPRLAQLNFEMDMKLKASEEYMETHFPENERLFNKLQAKIKMNIDQTDPKNFTGHKDAPKFTNNSSKINEQRKEIIKKHFKKSVKIKKPFKY